MYEILSIGEDIRKSNLASNIVSAKRPMDVTATTFDPILPNITNTKIKLRYSKINHGTSILWCDFKENG